MSVIRYLKKKGWILSAAACFFLYLCPSCQDHRVLTPESFFSKDPKSELFFILQDELTIKDIVKERETVRLELSDGSSVFFPNVLIGRIGLDGFWYVDGKNSEYRWRNSDVKSVYCDLKSYGVDDFGEGGLLGIFEGYSAWSFFFMDDDVISINKSIFSYNPDSYMKGIGHRGLSKMAPENTLPSFRLSRLNGFSFVETDIRFTADGIPVLLHDEMIDRTSNGSGRVQDYSLAELKKYDFGTWKSAEYGGTQIPTFEEFLSLCCEIGLTPYIELKVGTNTQIEGIVDLVDGYGLLEKATFVSFNLSYLECVHNYNPSVRLGLVTNAVTERTISQAKSIMGDTNDVYVGASDWGEIAVNLCKNSGLPLEVWTVDNSEKILSLPDYVTGVVSNSLHAGRCIHDFKVE